MCSRLNCRFIHLTEDDKVEVCDQRVAVCRDHANGQCRRKLCKYYHIPVALPPANIMATIFNQTPAQQQPLHQQHQLAATSTISSNEQQQEQLQNQQQLTTTTNATRATSATYATLNNNNYNNNNNFMSSFSSNNNNNNNNILFNNVTDKNTNNIVTPHQHQHSNISPPLLPSQVSSNSLNAVQKFTLASSKTPINESSNIPALTNPTDIIPNSVMATTTTTSTNNNNNVSAVAAIAATANAYTPTFQRFLKTQSLITPALEYYDIINHGLSNINTNCFTLLPSNPTYAAAPILYPTVATAAAAQHQHQNQNQPPSGVNIKNIQLSTSNVKQQASNTPNLPAIVTTSTK